MQIKAKISSSVIVIFGGTGDLAKRKLIPALYNLYLNGCLPEQFEIIGLGRTQLLDAQYRERLFPDLCLFSRSGIPDGESWQRFSSRISYLSADIASAESYNILKNKIEGIEGIFGDRSERIFYLSVAPHFIGVVSEKLKNIGLADQADSDRIVIEKPFGEDKRSSTVLNELLGRSFQEKQIYRIDHYLGKETVQNILSFRFANNIFEPLWNAQYIESVEIDISEKVGVEGRGGYFESAGSLRDMIQNHLLQILSLIAMEPPEHLDPEHVRDKKLQALDDIRPISDHEVSKVATRGQYTGGMVDGEDVVGYRQETGVDPRSGTETFASIKLFLDNSRWSGVPFYLSSGKRMGKKSSSVTITFRHGQNSLFTTDNKAAQGRNKLIINLQPATDITLSMNARLPGSSSGLRTSEMVFPLGLDIKHTPEAYETLLLDVLHGDPSLFMRADQVEKAWEVIMPILETWSQNADDLHFYPSGSPFPIPSLVTGGYSLTQAKPLVLEE